MMLTAKNLRVVHVTTHIGLIDAVERITPDRVYRVIKLVDATLRKAGIAQPKIAVCGINPHAGEHGLFGHGEDEQKIAAGDGTRPRRGHRRAGAAPRGHGLLPRRARRLRRRSWRCTTTRGTGRSRCSGWSRA